MGRKQEPFEVGAVEVLRKSREALLVATEDHGEQWIPFSQIHEDSAVDEDATEGDKDELVVTQWLAEERGWA